MAAQLYLLVTLHIANISAVIRVFHWIYRVVTTSHTISDRVSINVIFSITKLHYFSRLSIKPIVMVYIDTQGFLLNLYIK